MPKRDRQLEREIIGIALNDSDARWELFTSLDPQDFTISDGSDLWAELQQLSAEGVDVSYYEAVQLLGGEYMELLGKAHETYQGTMNLEEKMKKLQSLSRVRRWLQHTRRVGAKIKRGDDSDEVLQRYVGQMMNLIAPQAGKRILPPEEWLPETYKEAEKRHQNVQEGGMPYLDLGFPDFSRVAAILPQNLVFLCGQTGQKKSMLALNIAVHTGMALRIPTLYLNTEMSKHEAGMRAAAMTSGAEGGALRTGVAWERGGAVLQAWMDGIDLEEYELYLTDSLYDLTSMDVVTLLRQYKHQHGIEVAFVDYVQRLRDSGDGEDDWQRLVDATSRIKSAAQEMDIIIFTIAQLTDSGHLQRARYMKNEVDAMWTLEEDEEQKNEYLLTVEKARHTEDRFAQRLKWDGQDLRFREV